MANCLKSRIYIRLEPPDWEALWYLGCDPEVIRMSFDPNVTPELLKTINHYHDLFISEKLKESF